MRRKKNIEKFLSYFIKLFLKINMNAFKNLKLKQKNITRINATYHILNSKKSFSSKKLPLTSFKHPEEIQ